VNCGDLFNGMKLSFQADYRDSITDQRPGKSLLVGDHIGQRTGPGTHQ
jgi:hypothetical protein